MILTKKQANTFNATTVTPPANNTNNSKSARSAFFNSQLYVRYDNCPIIFVMSNFVILNIKMYLMNLEKQHTYRLALLQKLDL